MVGVELIELAPGVRHAAGFDHALLEQRLVADVVIAYERARPVPEERAGMPAAAPLGKVVHHDRCRIVFGGAVAP